MEGFFKIHAFSMFITALFTIARTWKQPKLSIDKGMDKEDVVHVYNEILLSHKNERNSDICRDEDDLEIVIQSEVSQKEKNKYRIISLICGI